MKQDHTEESILHSDGQQNTGNHKDPAAADAKGADKFGGTRAGAENVEQAGAAAEEENADLERARPLDASPPPDLGTQSRSDAERDG